MGCKYDREGGLEVEESRRLSGFRESKVHIYYIRW